MIFKNKIQITAYDKKKNALRNKELEGEAIEIDDGLNLKLSDFL